ncbi:sodium:dicarboxylate symporter [Alicycliphilus sp. B1]|nr:sodium:dicarboxylate symporter [Alicycliphilus sp. B1]
MLNFLDALTEPVFKVVGIVMKAAPVGAFGAMAFTIGKFGLGSLVNLAWLVGFVLRHLAAVRGGRPGHRGAPVRVSPCSSWAAT